MLLLQFYPDLPRRDRSRIIDYFGRTSTGTTYSYTDSSTNGDVHTYYVVAVDQSYTESSSCR